MKIFSVFVLVLSCVLVPCQADTTPTQTFDVTTMCDPNLNPSFPSCSVPAKINAVLTTQMETGTFYAPADQEFFEATVPVVTDITGTFDGLPMTLIPRPAPFIGYLLQLPANIAFVAGGIQYDLSIGNANDVFLNSGFQPDITPIETLDFTAVENVPESPLFWMLLTGLFLLGLSSWARVSLRKLSHR